MQTILTRHYRQHVYPHIRPEPYVEQEESELLLLPFFHVYGFGALISCLLNGSTGLVMAKFEQDLFCRTVQDYKIRLVKLVPPILVFLAKSPKLDSYDFSHLRVIITGAAPVGPEICTELKRRFPHLQFVAQGFGMTEMSVATHLPMPLEAGSKHDSVGKLAPNLEMKLVDILTGDEVEQGIPGEVHFRGPTRMLGYHGKPEETAQAIDSEGWLRTGDVAYVDRAGFMHIVDRHKELIKVNGLQVAPSELEHLLLSHPDVQDCAVIGVPDPNCGELPKAFVVKKAGVKLTVEDVQQFMKAKAVYYKQLKGGVDFVNSIPKSPSGKILRRLLKGSENESNKKRTDNKNIILSKL